MSCSQVHTQSRSRTHVCPGQACAPLAKFQGFKYCKKADHRKCEILLEAANVRSEEGQVRIQRRGVELRGRWIQKQAVKAPCPVVSLTAKPRSLNLVRTFCCRFAVHPHPAHFIPQCLRGSQSKFLLVPQEAQSMVHQGCGPCQSRCLEACSHPCSSLPGSLLFFKLRSPIRFPSL